MKLYWTIDCLIDSHIDWSLTEPSWDGRGLTSGPNQYDPIQYSLCFFVFFFPCANLCGTERTKADRNTQESIIAVIHWLSMNSKYLCHSFGELGWQGLKWGFWGTTLPSMDMCRCCWLPADYIIVLTAPMCFSQMLRLRQREETVVLHSGNRWGWKSFMYVKFYKSVCGSVKFAFLKNILFIHSFITTTSTELKIIGAVFWLCNQYLPIYLNSSYLCALMTNLPDNSTVR